MWPKALIELAPHLVRLVPAANRFFSDKASGDEANRKAMEAMAAGLRGDLGQVTAAHSGLYRQLNEQAEKLSGVASDLGVVRVAVESTDGRVARMQRKISTLSNLLIAALVMNFVLMLMMFALLFKH